MEYLSHVLVEFFVYSDEAKSLSNILRITNIFKIIHLLFINDFCKNCFIKKALKRQRKWSLEYWKSATNWTKSASDFAAILQTFDPTKIGRR